MGNKQRQMVRCGMSNVEYRTDQAAVEGVCCVWGEGARNLRETSEVVEDLVKWDEWMDAEVEQVGRSGSRADMSVVDRLVKFFPGRAWRVPLQV